MTYSRPQTRQTRISNRPSRPDRVRLGSTPSVATGSNSRVIDLSSPQQAGKNAAKPFEEFSAFLKGIAEPVTDYLASEDIADANRQVGELIANNPKLPELFREAPEEAQDKIRSLSPRARDIYLQDVAQGAAVEYGESFAAAVENDALLQQPTNDSNREAQDKRFAELQAEAMAPVTNLPPEYIPGVTERIASADGLIKAGLEKSRLASQRNIEATEQSNVFSQIIIDATAKGVSSDSAGGDLQATQENADKASEEIRKKIIDSINNGQFTEQQSALNFIVGAQRQVNELINSGEYNEAVSFLSTLKSITNRELMVGPEGKTNFWDLTIQTSNGRIRTIQDWIKATSKDVRDQNLQGDQDRVKQIIRSYLPGLTATLSDGSPDIEARQQAEESAKNALFIDADPVAISNGLGLLNQLTGRLAEPTQRQKDAAVLITGSKEYRQATLERKQEMLIQAVQTKQISSTQFQDEMKRIETMTQTEVVVTNDLDIAQKLAGKNGKDAYLRETLSKAQEESLEALGTSADENEKEDLLNSRIEQVKARAFNSAMEEILRQSQNKDLSKEDRYEIYFEKLEEEMNEERESYLTVSGLVGSTERRTQAFVEAIPARLRNNPAEVMKDPMKMFTPELIQSYKEAAGKDPKSWKDVFEYLAGRMAQVKDANDEFVYGKDKDEATKFLREMYKKAVKAEMPSQQDSPGVQWWPGSKEMPAIDNKSRQNPSGVQWWPGSKESKGQDQGSVAEPQEGATYDWLEKALTSIAGGEAKAGTLDNKENLLAMAQIWSGRQPLSIRTPGLPQKSASDSATTPTMALTSINHPYALAIGIAEGNRTADGGLTVHYYGHKDPADQLRGSRIRNIGNFSARQGQATPQIADRQWLSTLTGTQMTYAPVLERAGIKRGTQGYNRLMFNILDLRVQAPSAVPGFVAAVPQMLAGGMTIEAIARARANAYYMPSGWLNAPGFGNNFTRLFKDQRSRAGVWDYRKRI